jgi:hypothetical protein
MAHFKIVVTQHGATGTGAYNNCPLATNWKLFFSVTEMVQELTV